MGIQHKGEPAFVSSQRKVQRKKSATSNNQTATEKTTSNPSEAAFSIFTPDS